MPVHQQELAILSLLELRDDIGLPEARRSVPLMAALSRRHAQLSLEAAAVALTLPAEVWLSPQATAGVLPGVLDAESIPWRAIDLLVSPS